MKKESLGLYLFRLFLLIGVFVFLGMLYWSFTLMEQDVKQINMRLQTLESNVESVQYKTKSSENRAFVSTQDEAKTNHSLLPNLLQKDPFYEETLPKLLGNNFRPHGVLRTAVVFRPQNLHPYSNWGQVATWVGQCNVSVAKLAFGKYETFAPNMALKVEEKVDEKGQKLFWVYLKDHVYWQPLQQLFFPELPLAPHFLKTHQVTAEDYKFAFDVIMNPYVEEPGAVALRTLYEDIEEIKVIDPLTFTVKWKGKAVKDRDGKDIFLVKYIAKQRTGGLSPLARFVYQYFADGTKIVPEDSDPNTYRTNSVWAQNFSRHWANNIIVSCGPWIFTGKTERQITFKRNPDHYFPLNILIAKSEVRFKDTLDAIWQDFKGNELDLYEIRPEQILELNHFLESPEYEKQKNEGHAIRRLDYVGRMFAYIGWNAAKPLFASKKVRQALTMAIDRQRIIRQNLNGMGIEITGPIYRYSPSYDADIQPWPYDPLRAKRILEEEGWFDLDGDGVIDKEIDGKRTPFRFNLTYYVKAVTTKAICEYIATALKDIGIDCRLNGVDIADISTTFDEKSFDALTLAWSFGTPPEDPRQLWHSSGAKIKGSSNAFGFANAEVDKIIDELDYESNREKRIKLYHQFHRIMHEEEPYTFLYTPKVAFLYRDRIQNVFLPIEKQDLIPGANIAEPDPDIFWIKE